MKLRYLALVSLLLVLSACGLPTPDQARRNLAPNPPLTPEYRDVPLLRLEVHAEELFPLLFGENPNAELFTLTQEQGRMRPGDLALRIAVPDTTIGFQVSLSQLNQEIAVPFTLPQIPGIGQRLQALLAQIGLPEAYLVQDVILTSPSQYALAGQIRVCNETGSVCSQFFGDETGQQDNLRFNNGQPKRLIAESSGLFSALGSAPFQRESHLVLRLVPRGTVLDYASQNGCDAFGCTVRQNITNAVVVAPFGGVARDPFTVESMPLASPVSGLPQGWVEDLKRYTVSSELTLEIVSSLPTSTLGLDLWVGPGTSPRFDNPGPTDFVYRGRDPIPSAPVDGEGRSTGTVQTTVRTVLEGADLERFLNVLAQKDVHAAVRLTLQGPEASQGVFRYRAEDSLRIFAKGTVRLSIGGQQ